MLRMKKYRDAKRKTMIDARILLNVIGTRVKDQRDHDRGKGQEQHIMNAVDKPRAQEQPHDNKHIADKPRVFFGCNVNFGDV